MTDKIESHDRLLRIAWWVLGATVLGLTIAIRIRLLGIPLERDEGEYAYAGQLMLQGVAPYKLAYNMKFPGTYAAFAAIMLIFGQTITAIHLGLLFLNAATVALIFFLGRRLANSTAGIAAAASYAVLSVSPSVLGLAAHATHFVMLPVLGGAFLLLNRWDRHSLGRLFASGSLFGIGLLMKQPAVFLTLFGAIYLFCRDYQSGRSWRQTILRNTVFSCGALLPFGVTCLLLGWAGVFPKFWFWTIEYARQYGSRLSFSQGAEVFAYALPPVIGFDWLLWMLAGVGLIACVWDKRLRASGAFLAGLLMFSTLALCSGFYFRQHYFIFVLPALSLLGGVAISKTSEVLSGSGRAVCLLLVLLFGVALTWPIFGERELFFSLTPHQACRIIYGENPFEESIRVADYVHNHTSSNDTIAILGSEPQIYFYSKRHSATGYIYTYGLMEPQQYAHQMELEMIREITLARPKYLISVVINYSWLRQPRSDELIFTWANQYTAQNYTVAGFVNIVGLDRTDYYFGDIPASVAYLRDYILIYKRKS